MTGHMCSVTEEEPGMFAVSCDSCDLSLLRNSAKRAGGAARRHERATKPRRVRGTSGRWENAPT
jgi:hypothetical protein